MTDYGITTENLLSTLPDVLSTNQDITAIAKGIAAAFEEIAQSQRAISIYQNIDTAPERVLDILAESFNIAWYSPEHSLSQKREILKKSWFVFRQLGTVSAVSRVLVENFGSGQIQEWFEYGGEHHHFKIVTTEISRVYENCENLLHILSYVKRASAVLDSIEIKHESRGKLGVGIASSVELKFETQTDSTDVSGYVFACNQDSELLLDETGSPLLCE